MTGPLGAYLARLGLADLAGAPPSVAALRRIQAAHVERVPYENVDIYRGTPPPIDPATSIRRIVAGRGGYCYHLNGALAVLLERLGYAVERHVGGVWNDRDTSLDPTDPAQAMGNHLALSVQLDGERWFVDVGLGDGLHDVVALTGGPVTVRQGFATYRLEPLDDGGWRFHHDPAQGSFTAMDFTLEPVATDRFAARHEDLSTSPQSGFVRACTVQRRTADAAYVLRGLVLTTVDAGGRHRQTLDAPADWFAALADVFGLDLTSAHGAGLDGAARDALWRRLAADHEAWLAGS